jgi:hypothetical protein
MKAYFRIMRLEALEDFLRPGSLENTDVHTGKAEIGCHLDMGHGHKMRAVPVPSLPLKELSQFLLDEPGIFLLTNRVHDTKVMI